MKIICVHTYIIFQSWYSSMHCFLSQGKADAQSRLKAAQSELAQLQDSLDEEQEAKDTLQKQLLTAKNEASTFRNQFENEATPRIEELEEAK